MRRAATDVKQKINSRYTEHEHFASVDIVNFDVSAC